MGNYQTNSANDYSGRAAVQSIHTIAQRKIKSGTHKSTNGMEVKLSELRPNPQNPRGAITHDVALRELAMSIKAQGVLQPLLITPDNLIVCGHRRFEAARLAECEIVPVLIKNLNETEQLQVMLAENLQRKDLDVVQEGKAYLSLQSRGLSVNKISQAVGIHNARVTRLIEIAQLPIECHPIFASGQVAFGRADCLLDLPRDKQILWAERAKRNNWNGAKLAEAIWQDSHPSTSPVEVRSLNPKKTRIGNAIRLLERADEELDTVDCRATQALLRQAMNQLLDLTEKQG
jgi:ParB/RepB/Spo0J family partition protein